jgi:RNA polymerase sigma-70 factor (ECF subfamily)
MDELTPREVEAQLGRLHEDSFGWALSCCGWHEADAEDVLQSTYLKVVSGKARFGGRSSFRTWLFGVIRQTAREHHRRARSQSARVEALASEGRHAEDSVEAPDQRVERAEVDRLLLESLSRLPRRQREVLHLVFYQDLSIREAAEVMEVSLGSARVHYDRGKKKLRAMLSEEQLDGGPT